MKKKKELPITLSVEGSSDISLKLPSRPDQEWRAMTVPETYIISCYAIWEAAQDDNRALALRNEIMGLTLTMMNEGETIH